MVDPTDARIDWLGQLGHGAPRDARCGEPTVWTLRNSADAALAVVLETGDARVPLPVGLDDVSIAWVSDYVWARIAAMRNG